MTTTDNGRDPFDWLTIPDILTDLDIPLSDWQEWETTGQAPSGVIFPDGQIRISRLATDGWTSSPTTRTRSPTPKRSRR